MVCRGNDGRSIACLDALANVAATVSRGCMASSQVSVGRSDLVGIGHRWRTVASIRGLDGVVCYGNRNRWYGASGMKRFEIFSDPVLFQLGPVPLTQTMATSVCVSIGLVSTAALMRMALTRHSTGYLVSASQWIYVSIEQMVKDVVGRSVPWLVIYAGTLFLFIAGCNVSGQFPGVHPPTANLAATSALAVVVFVTVPVAGILSQGFAAYIKHYFKPNPLLFPLHLISEVSRTFALSVRLFGNMMSGHLIVALLVALAGFLVPMPLMALDLLIGLLQAYIFTLLSIVYIGAALRTGAG